MSDWPSHLRLATPGWLAVWCEVCGARTQSYLPGGWTMHQIADRFDLFALEHAHREEGT